MPSSLTRSCRATCVCGVTVLLALACTGCANRLLTKLEAFRAAKRRGDYAEAAKYLADDARIWHVKKEGPGKPYTVKGGPWKDWDREFNGSSTREHVRVSNHTVSYLSTETNDFYRLIEHPPARARITYYFDDEGRISGMFYEPINRDDSPASDRQDEFEQWRVSAIPVCSTHPR